MEHLENHPYAFLNEENIVLEVLLFEEHNNDLLNKIKEHLGANRYVSCCEVGPISKDFIEINNKYYPPQPYPSWTVNEELTIWDPPIAYPNDGENYIWDENTLSWLLLPPSN